MGCRIYRQHPASSSNTLFNNTLSEAKLDDSAGSSLRSDSDCLLASLPVPIPHHQVLDDLPSQGSISNLAAPEEQRNPHQQRCAADACHRTGRASIPLEYDPGVCVERQQEAEAAGKLCSVLGV